MPVMKVELFIPSELKDEPIICDMIKNFDIELKIIEASFSTESGWALLVIKSDSKEAEKLLKYLRGKNINVEIRD